MLPAAAEVNREMDATAVMLAVAGFDPSSGAGVTADLQVFANHQLNGFSAITALTVQSRQGVREVRPVSAQLLRKTLDCLAEDLPIGGVKIGMLGNLEIAREVVEFLRSADIRRERVVLDPVVRSSSGAELLSPEGLELVRRELLPVVGWVTPNTGELAALVGQQEIRREEIPELAARLQEMGRGGVAVVVTGGHLEPPDDFLRKAEGQEEWFSGVRIEARGLHGAHGTGCMFSSALLCRLMLGDGATEAVRGAKAYVRRALETGRRFAAGRGDDFLEG